MIHPAVTSLLSGFECKVQVSDVLFDFEHKELTRREAAYDVFYNQVKVLCRFSEMSYHEIVDYANQLIARYFELRSEFSDELAHF